MSTHPQPAPAPPAPSSSTSALASPSSTTLAPLPTPAKCTADFCLIPLGTPTASVSAHIADVQRLLKRSGLSYVMHSAGTTVEGSWDEVMRLIGQAHTLVHQGGVVRVQSDVRVGTRTDKAQSMRDKVEAVERLLAMDEKGEGGE